MYITPEFLVKILVLLTLFLFGVGYNYVTGQLEQKQLTEGLLSLMVSLGVGVTLVGVAVIDWRAAALTLLAFMFSGTPMIVGRLWRHQQARNALHKAIKNGDTRDQGTPLA